MTNILYFHSIVRDADSASSSSREEQIPEDGQVVNMEASSLYSIIGQACLACARPQVDLVNDDDDTSSTTGDVDDQVLDALVPGVNLQGISNNRKLDGDVTDMSQCSIFKCFSLYELKTATRNFCTTDLIPDYSGLVYEGWVDEHTLTASKHGRGISVAIKRLNQENYLGKSEWLEGVISMGQLHHPNLARLLGYCLEDEDRLLVCELVTPGSLKDHLYGRIPIFQPLSWTLRMKVALGAAKGLAFLHSVGKIVHPNFDSSNIFVDKDHDAKLSGFMLTEGQIDSPEEEMETINGYDICWPGTRARRASSTYASPEYVYEGNRHRTYESDVYSFGVVLLEILCGRLSCGRLAFHNNRPSGEVDLVEWARPLMHQKPKIFHLLDSRLEGQYSRSGAEKVVILCQQCLALDPRSRPSMDKVVKALQKRRG